MEKKIIPILTLVLCILLIGCTTTIEPISEEQTTTGSEISEPQKTITETKTETKQMSNELKNLI